MMGTNSTGQLQVSPPPRADGALPQPRHGAAAQSRAARLAGADEAGRRGKPVGAPDVRPRLDGAIGYALHGATFLALAIAALAYFGSVFWFVSTVSAALAFSSLHHAYAALRARQSVQSER